MALYSYGTTDWHFCGHAALRQALARPSNLPSNLSLRPPSNLPSNQVLGRMAPADGGSAMAPVHAHAHVSTRPRSVPQRPVITIMIS